MNIQHEFQSEIDKFIQQHNACIVDSFRRNGEWKPKLTLLHYNHKSKAFDTSSLPVPPQALNTEAGKDLLVNLFFPLAIKIVNNQKGAEVICVNWTYEVFLRLLDPSGDSKISIKENWRELPRRDCVLSISETKVSQYGKTWEIKTTANQVIDNQGRLAYEKLLHDFNELPSEGVSFQGRFSHILKDQPSFS